MIPPHKGAFWLGVNAFRSPETPGLSEDEKLVAEDEVM